jgi:hypothetical protein
MRFTHGLMTLISNAVCFKALVSIYPIGCFSSLRAEDPDAGDWENGGLYKPCIVPL